MVLEQTELTPAPVTPEDIAAVTHEQLEEMCNQQKWKWAKTYAKFAPHEYFLKPMNYLLFKALKRFIAEEGVEEEFRIYSTVKMYKYYYVGDYKYWGYDLVMNRTRVAGYEGRDGWDGYK